jgi:hypothetical protein
MTTQNSPIDGRHTSSPTWKCYEVKHPQLEVKDIGKIFVRCYPFPVAEVPDDDTVFLADEDFCYHWEYIPRSSSDNDLGACAMRLKHVTKAALVFDKASLDASWNDGYWVSIERFKALSVTICGLVLIPIVQEVGML